MDASAPITAGFSSRLAEQIARLDDRLDAAGRAVGTVSDAASGAGSAPGAPGAVDGVPRAEAFADTLARAAQEITETLARGEATATQGVSGAGDAQAVVEALTATELALQTAVTVRDRVVEAYQEVLRMPV